MNVVTCKGWTFTRLVGQSEIENVRALLLQVTAFSTQCLNAQIAGIINACNILDHRARIYINAGRLGKEHVERLIQTELTHSKEHDLIELPNTEKAFASTISKTDIVIQAGSEPISADEICKSLIQLWTNTGKRGGILNGKGATEEELARLRHVFYVNMEACQKEFYGE